MKLEKIRREKEEKRIKEQHLDITSKVASFIKDNYVDDSILRESYGQIKKDFEVEDTAKKQVSF